ncbi:MAG: radical SAM protein, partial [Promethearchaeota archaeon]
FERAKKHGLYNTFVSNGYMTEDVLRDLVNAGLNAMNVDIKGNAEMVKKYCGADVEKVWRNVKLAKDLGVHIEITTLLITELNTDSSSIRDISKRISNELGTDTPFHLTRFYPQYKSVDHGLSYPTTLEDLNKAYNIARNEGLKFVYLGNMPDTDYVKTICPNCSKIVIRRDFFGLNKLKINKSGNCRYCGYQIIKVR